MLSEEGSEEDNGISLAADLTPSATDWWDEVCVRALQFRVLDFSWSSSLPVPILHHTHTHTHVVPHATHVGQDTSWTPSPSGRPIHEPTPPAQAQLSRSVITLDLPGLVASEPAVPRWSAGADNSALVSSEPSARRWCSAPADEASLPPGASGGRRPVLGDLINRFRHEPPQSPGSRAKVAADGDFWWRRTRRWKETHHRRRSTDQAPGNSRSRLLPRRIQAAGSAVEKALAAENAIDVEALVETARSRVGGDALERWRAEREKRRRKDHPPAVDRGESGGVVDRGDKGGDVRGADALARWRARLGTSHLP